MLEYRVKRGEDIGIVLVPHRFGDGRFRASKTKFGAHQPVSTEEELIRWMDRGYSVRMSRKDKMIRRGPSLIAPRLITRN